MKKLNLLKAIVDYVWIMSLICYPLIIVASILLMVDSEAFSIPLKISGNEIELNTIWSKIALTISVANFGLILYALYNFKNLLNNFKGKLIFEKNTCLMLDKIGKLIICSSLVYATVEVIIRLSKEIVSIEFGFGPFLYLVSLGLFFIVLSEVFKIGKNIKDENDLTL